MYNKIKYGLLIVFLFSYVRGVFFEIHSAILGVFVSLIFIFNAFIGFSVIYCLYEDMLKIFFDTFRKMAQKCKQISHELFFCDFLGFGRLWGS